MAIHLKSVALHPDSYPRQEHYPFNLAILKHTRRLTFDAPVTLFVGENGTGKSTLLEALATACGIHIWRPPEGMRCELNPHEGTLWKHLGVEWSREPVPGSFFGADIARHFAYLLDEWAADDKGQLKYFGGKSLVTQSHGQSLLSLFRSRYRIRGVYFLDEPEAALSPRSQLEFLKIVAEATANCEGQFIISTHSPLLLACPGALIYNFDNCPVSPISYEETGHYQVYKNFLMDRSKWL
jgi:predicted ATPase